MTILKIAEEIAANEANEAGKTTLSFFCHVENMCTSLLDGRCRSGVIPGSLVNLCRHCKEAHTRNGLTDNEVGLGGYDISTICLLEENGTLAEMPRKWHHPIPNDPFNL